MRAHGKMLTITNPLETIGWIRYVFSSNISVPDEDGFPFVKPSGNVRSAQCELAFLTLMLDLSSKTLHSA